MYVDHARAALVFDILVAARKKSSFPYIQAETPQSIVADELVQYTELQRSRFWFYMCMYMRGPVKSNDAARVLLRIFIEQNGEGIFNPLTEDARDPEHIVKVMEEHNFLRLLRDVKKFWSFGSIKLMRDYAGDPRNIFNHVESFADIEQRCRYDEFTGEGFMGFQKKMSSMLTYFLRDQKLIGIEDFPPPVDFHLMRVMVLTGVLVLEANDPRKFRYETSSVLGYEAIETYLATHREVHPIVLGDSLWLLSSNLCNRSPKNFEARAFGTFDEELINKAPASKRKRLEKPPGLFTVAEIPVHVNHESERMQAVCGCCPALKYCKGGLPAVEYYNYGLLEYREL